MNIRYKYRYLKDMQYNILGVLRIKSVQSGILTDDYIMSQFEKL